MTGSRKLVCLIAPMLLVLGAAAASAQAATFHKPAETIKLKVTPDGSTTTAHQVFEGGGAQVTCPNVDGQAEVAGSGNTFSEVTSSIVEYTVSGSTCKYVGQLATVKMNGCNYEFVAAAEGVSARAVLKCPTLAEIEISVPSPSCFLTIERAEVFGITYHNINSKSEVTVEVHAENISDEAKGAGCPSPGSQTNGGLKTGNVIITAENTAGVMKPVFVE